MKDITNVVLTGLQTYSPYPQAQPYQPPQPAATPYQPPYQQPRQQALQYPQTPNLNQDFQSLHRDVDELIRKTREEFAANIHDSSIQTRLKALLDLQSLMQHQHLPPHEMQMIRDQVAALSRPSFNATNPVSSLFPGAALPGPPPPSQSQQPQQSMPSSADIQSLLSSNNLADIIAKAQRATPTPPLQHASLAHVQPSALNASQLPNAGAPAAGPNLLASLRAAGLIPSGAQTSSNGIVPYGTPPVQGIQPNPPGSANDVELTSASLKV